MMVVLQSIDFSLPLVNPVLKFLIILLIILSVPILFNRIKIPPILGLILAGAIIGPHAFNLLQRDSGIILSGTAGLLYIMFLAGLEVDIGDFKKNRFKSIIFGLYTFAIPMILGIFTGLYVLKFTLITSVLLASMFASHTLIAYPIIRKLGITRNIAVTITVGGTIITDTLALLVLAVIVGMTKGEINSEFWIRLTLQVILFGIIVLFVFPIIARWFFRKVEDNVAQYIFVLAMVFLAAFLAELAGVEGIIGAFLAGLSLNRLIPRNSTLMNRVEFVGNAIFIPFFLIGIGMLIDYKIFFEDLDTLRVGGIMIVVATASKYLAALLTQKTFNFSKSQTWIIFGLSNAQAAATLAAVIIGYNIILDETETGEPIRLLNENVLNGTILMILVTCTIATFSAAKGAKQIILGEMDDSIADGTKVIERILISFKNNYNVEELVNLAGMLKTTKSTDLYGLSVVNNSNVSEEEERYSRRLLNHASELAISNENFLNEILRYDSNFENGILSAVRENQITDVILGLHVKQELKDSFLGNLTESVLSKIAANTFIYKSFQPLSTIQRHLIYLPKNIEDELGFPGLMKKLWQLGNNSGAQLIFYASDQCISILKNLNKEFSVQVEYRSIKANENSEKIISESKRDDNLIFVQKTRQEINTLPFENIIPMINTLVKNNFILIYLYSSQTNMRSKNLMNASFIEPI